MHKWSSIDNTEQMSALLRWAVGDGFSSELKSNHGIVIVSCDFNISADQFNASHSNMSHVLAVYVVLLRWVLGIISAMEADWKTAENKTILISSSFYLWVLRGYQPAHCIRGEGDRICSLWLRHNIVCVYEWDNYISSNKIFWFCECIILILELKHIYPNNPSCWSTLMDGS